MPSEGDLKRGAGLIRYEYLMLARVAQVWMEEDLGTYSRATKWRTRMITDAFLLHARNLIDFVAPATSARPGDVVATHYNESWTSSGGIPMAGRTVVEWRIRINKLLSHVTYERSALIEQTGQQRWPIDELYRGVEGMLAEFLRTLPRERREWFGSEIPAT
jgi:hypothetical protein